MSVEMMTFPNALAEAKTGNADISLLLGNGFSQALSNDFGYTRLRDVADMDANLTVSQSALFEHAESDDFETVIHHLEQSAHLIQLYDPKDADLTASMRADAHAVKNGLVETLTSIHPASARQIEDSKYVAVRHFLSPFANIFTVNYDLLLYWAANQDQPGPEVVKSDGFRRPEGHLTWVRPDRDDSQKVFFLHGAMHLYTAGDEVRKLSTANGNIVDQLRDNLAAGRYPLVVTEGSRRNKEARIGQNPYLAYCHRRLTRLNGILFIHGMALSDNDCHILEAIADRPGRINALYVGLFGAPNAERNKVQHAAEQLAEACSAKAGDTSILRFYDSATAAPWG